jgi:hypothetical protein
MVQIIKQRDAIDYSRRPAWPDDFYGSSTEFDVDWSPDEYVPDSVVHQMRGGTPKGVYGWQTVKVRRLLAKIHSGFGYPFRLFHYIGYFSSLGLFVPDRWLVEAEGTQQAWEFANQERGLWQDYDTGELFYREDDWSLRQIKIAFAGDKFMDFVATAIPGKIDTLLFKGLSALSTKAIPVFENLGFYGTIADWVIARNWDKVRALLGEEGY